MATGTPLSRRMRPEYKAEKVDELPDDVVMPRKGPRLDPDFVEAMLVAQADPGAWYLVGTYKSDTGAKNMVKRIQLPEDNPQKVRLPAGDWELETRRVWAPDGKAKWSKLFARFEG